MSSHPEVAVREGAHSPAIVLAPVGIFETDANGLCTFVNERWCEFAGMRPEEALGTGWSAAIHPDDRDRVFEAWSRAVREGGELQLEFRSVRPDGATFWLDGRARALRGPGDRVTGYVGTLTDITAAVAAREQRIQEKQFVDTVLEIAGSLICVFDPQGRFLRFNRACELVSGWTFEEIEGRPFYEFLIPAGEVEAVKGALGRLRAGEPPAANENHWVTRSGALRLIRWSNASFFDERGTLTHIVSTGTDITEQRRIEDALRGIEAVGGLLARTGPTDGAMATVLDELSSRMNAPHVAVFIEEADQLRLAAQRGYEGLPPVFSKDSGIAGRVFGSSLPELVDDVSSDPDYVAGDPDVTSEIVVPLIADGETIGILSVGSTADAPLFAADLSLAQAVAERLAIAVRLGREQHEVAERARLLAAVSSFARRANGILDIERLLPELMTALGDVVRTDAIALTLLDRETGRYVIREVRGELDAAAIGREIVPGDGATGRAISERTLIVDAFDRASYSRPLRDTFEPSALYIAAVPLIREDSVLGAVSLGRRREGNVSFSTVECEVLTLVAAHAALALANADLLEEVRELAVRDTLTGLYNRRHFDATLDLVFARLRRARAARPLSAIIFDLDHFGRFNKEHGHQAGDAVLREFAGILTERFRSADLVARYGGEEFVAILEETDLHGALTVAEEIRAMLAGRTLVGPHGQELRATVSAGCATLDPAAPTRDALLRAADVGLFMAKRGGRNQVVAA